MTAPAPTLAAVVEAMLLFHAGGPWNGARMERWRDLTGSSEVTTRVLCDMARAALAQASSTMETL